MSGDDLRRQPLVIGDPELAGVRMGGTFSATTSTEFVNALSQTFGIRSVKDNDGSVILLPAQESVIEDGKKNLGDPLPRPCDRYLPPPPGARFARAGCIR